jgi:hypothetical protein
VLPGCNLVKQSEGLAAAKLPAKDFLAINAANAGLLLRNS